MPRTPTKSTKFKVELYPASSHHTSDSGSNDTKSAVKVSTNTGKAPSWTGEELQQLFDFALNRNGRSWGEAVPGKSATQAKCLWSNRILPYLKKALQERGK